MKKKTENKKQKTWREPLNYIKEGDICVEIGVWKGDFSQEILKYNPSKLHLIDPWAYQAYEGRWYSLPQDKMDEIYSLVGERFNADKRVEIHRDFSANVNFPRNSLDWVYVDGNHSYQHALNDLNRFYDMLKVGGFLCGDDYGWTDKFCPHGPKKAVDEFVKAKNCKIIIDDDENQFVIFK